MREYRKQCFSYFAFMFSLGEFTELWVNLTFHGVFQHLCAQLFCHSRAWSHGRTAVYFQQPRLVVFTDDEISAIKFERILQNNKSQNKRAG